jgi:hypothetical protein
MCVLLSAKAQESGNFAKRYAQNSVLNSGKWVKISIPKTGIYKLTYEDLSAMGIKPENVRIFGYGGGLISELNDSALYIDDLPETAIYMNTGADNKFNAGDYILFYAQGIVSWTYGNPPNSSQKMFYHTLNHYANEAYYFVTSDVGIGKKITLQEAETQATAGDITTFLHYDSHEVELVNFPHGGRDFYGEEFNGTNISRTFTFNTPNVIAPISGVTASKMKIRVRAANKAAAQATLNVKLNESNVGNVTMEGNTGSNNYDIAKMKMTIFTFSQQAANQLEFTLTYSNAGATANLDFLEFNAPRTLKIDNPEFYFRNVDKIGLNQKNRFVVGNPSGATQIWDITDAANIRQLPITRSSESLTFIANTNTLHQYLAINPTAYFPKPTVVGTISNQNLHGFPQTDLVIITHKDFISEAERLAEAHRQIDNLRVQVVDAQSVYNEFSSGTPDASAYRRLMKMFYDRGAESGDLPQDLLLLGDGCYDNRGLLDNTSNPIRRLLTYQAVNSTSTVAAYVCDDFFGYLEDGQGTMKVDTTEKMNIGVGRLPVYSTEQAKTVIDKTISYMENTFRTNWKNRIVFIGDDGDENDHVKSVDTVANITSRQNRDIVIRKLYLDAYKQETSAAGERYPIVSTLLDNYIQSGVLMINFMGHGSYNGWTNEQIMTSAKILNMANDKYPLFITATCDFTAYDQFYDTGGEQLLWNKTGGTMALVTTTRTVYSAPNFKLNCYFAKSVFEKDDNGNPISLGEAVKRAKNMQTDSQNKFSFALVGDPALRLVYPHEGNVITDTIKRNTVNPLALDTISALEEIEIAGHVETNLGDLITSFNGKVFVQVFDKLDSITTLANDAGSHSFHYTDRPNAIFSGSAQVKNGKFKLSFIVPKDIRYNFGTGRIVYYATENDYGMEANGHFEDFVIGGEYEGYVAENDGPKTRLYMNTPSFRDGGKTNSSPLFVAEVSDNSGINTVGNGIGHDIIMRTKTKDSKGQEVIKNEVVLNDYFETLMGSYKEGKVEYLLRDLPDGKYSIFFKVWDLQNNSTTDEISFEVSKDIRVGGVDTVIYYLDPVTNEVTFILNHDRPYKPLEITARVYDVAGRHIWTSERNVVTSGTHTEIKWNFAAEGMIISQGVFLAQIEIAAKDEKSSYKTLKLIISKQ